MKVSVPHPRTESHKYFFFPSAIRLWNSSPPYALHTESIQAFKPITED